VWYSGFLKTALRKHNLRVDLRVYIGDELEPSSTQDIEAKIKSILSSAIIKGLDVIGIVSRFGVEPGQIASRQAVDNRIDLKVIPGQDYISADKVKAVFYNLQKNIPPNLNIQDAIKQAKAQGGKVMLYDLSRSLAMRQEVALSLRTFLFTLSFQEQNLLILVYWEKKKGQTMCLDICKT